MLINVITVAAFLGLVGGVFLLRALIAGWRGTFNSQLAGEVGGGYVAPDPVFGDLTDPLAAQLPLLGSSDDSLTHDLRRAGYYKASARSEFMALRNILTI